MRNFFVVAGSLMIGTDLRERAWILEAFWHVLAW